MQIAPIKPNNCNFSRRDEGAWRKENYDKLIVVVKASPSLKLTAKKFCTPE